MSPVKVPPNLPDLVRTTFSKAKVNGDVNFYPTQVTVLWPALTPFQLRFSPTLANKPKSTAFSSSSSSSSPSSPGDSQKKPFNPFENPPPALTVAPIEPNHLLVLNKFAIVPEHSILITRAFKPQTHLLDAEDLAATYACIRAYHDCPTPEPQERREELLAFFNCGEHSGASQPHRHLQLLPVARMRDGLPPPQEGVPGWVVLADQIVGEPIEHTGRPFFTWGERLSPDMDAERLHAVYLRLYRIACAAAGVGKVSTTDGVEAQISYNLAMTKESMVIMPRTAEGAAVHDKQGAKVGQLALNGTVLAGTALVKNGAEWEALKEDPEQLLGILRQIGVDPTTVDYETMAKVILPQL
ncbi:unnamed protein product [Discula destructiva]